MHTRMSSIFLRCQQLKNEFNFNGLIVTNRKKIIYMFKSAKCWMDFVNEIFYYYPQLLLSIQGNKLQTNYRNKFDQLALLSKDYFLEGQI